MIVSGRPGIIGPMVENETQRAARWRVSRVVLEVADQLEPTLARELLDVLEAAAAQAGGDGQQVE